MMTGLADQRAALEAALTVRPTVAVLLDAGFQPARGTPAGDMAPDALVWLGEHAGQTLTILAGVDWFGQWKLVGTTRSRREAMWDERQVLDGWPQGAVLHVLAKLWTEAFRSAALPEVFRLGLVYREWNRVRRKLNPGLPRLDVDGPMLRLVVNRVRSAMESGEIRADADLRIAQISKQVLLRVGELEWMCPAQGCWVGMAEAKVAEFLRAVPGRFAQRTVRFDCDGRLLTVAGARVKVRWVD